MASFKVLALLLLSAAPADALSRSKSFLASPDTKKPRAVGPQINITDDKLTALMARIQDGVRGSAMASTVSAEFAKFPLVRSCAGRGARKGTPALARVNVSGDKTVHGEWLWSVPDEKHGSKNLVWEAWMSHEEHGPAMTPVNPGPAFAWMHNLKEPSLFIDIGANVGTTSLAVATEHTVIAVEPVKRNADLLCESMEANGFSPGPDGRYHLLEAAAVGDPSIDHVDITFPNGREDNTAISKDAATANIKRNTTTVSVPAVVLDRYLGALEKSGKMPKGGLRAIKMDAQGYEKFLLGGLKESIAKSTDLLMETEWDRRLMAMNGVDPGELEMMLRGWGFKPYDCKANIGVDANGAWVLKGREGIMCYNVLWHKKGAA